MIDNHNKTNMDPENIIDLVIERKQFKSWKVISQGKFSATIEVDYQEKEKKKAMLILSKIESDNRRFEFENIQNGYTIQTIGYEYICKLQAYIIYTESTEYTLQDKIANKVFRKSPESLALVCNWIKEISLGLKKIHHNSYVHLNIHPKIILITPDNRAKIGGFDFSRHSSTQTTSSEYGSERHYHPPERFPSDCGATDGNKFDVWCLTMLAVECLTGNYIAKKSTTVTSWPEQYLIIHKILQPPKFKKIVKHSYPKSAKGEYLEQILRLIKHTLKWHPEERPNISEFSLFMFELTFLKYIDKELVAEEMWNKKVPLVEVEHKMVMMALDQWQKMGVGKTPRVASKMTMIEFAEGPKDQMLGRESEPPERAFHSHHLLRSTVGNRNQIQFPVDSKVTRNDKVIITTSDEDFRKKFSKDITIQKEENLLSNKNEINPTGGVTGDFVSDDFNCRSKDNDEIPFEHMHVQFEEDSSPGKLRSRSESTEIVKPVKNENDIANPDLIKNTDEEIYLSKQEETDSVQLNIFEADKITNNVYNSEKHNDVVNSESPIYLNQNNRAKTARGNFSAKNILLNVVNWACDEAFYTGVMNHGSFISKVSKTLTG